MVEMYNIIKQAKVLLKYYQRLSNTKFRLYQKQKQKINQNGIMMINKKVLFVLTSHDKKGPSGKPTGYYLKEVSHPWQEFINAGFIVDFVSPKGGNPPVDGFDEIDAINAIFLASNDYRQKVQNSLTPQQINPEQYCAIFYAGGHGTMWDFAENIELQEIARQIYENKSKKGIIGAVCHGPAALINIKLSNGQYLVANKAINAFTNEEEIAVGLQDIVPFMLEDKLIERGAKFEKSDLWEKHIAVDDRVVTGQNPASAAGVAIAMIAAININD
jgi:putative intracellular protease/amidase